MGFHISHIVSEPRSAEYNKIGFIGRLGSVWFKLRNEKENDRIFVPPNLTGNEILDFWGHDPIILS